MVMVASTSMIYDKFTSVSVLSDVCWVKGLSRCAYDGSSLVVGKTVSLPGGDSEANGSHCIPIKIKAVALFSASIPSHVQSILTRLQSALYNIPMAGFCRLPTLLSTSAQPQWAGPNVSPSATFL